MTMSECGCDNQAMQPGSVDNTFGNSPGVRLNGNGDVTLDWQITKWGGESQKPVWFVDYDQGQWLAARTVRLDEQASELLERIHYYEFEARSAANLMNYERGPARWLLAVRKTWFEGRARRTRRRYERKLDRIDELNDQLENDFRETCWDTKKHTTCDGEGPC